MRKATPCLAFGTGNPTVMVLFLFAILVASCKKDMNPELTANALATEKKDKDKKPDFIVTAGSSIQRVINMAPAGSIVLIQSGVYKEAVTISQPNITVRGEDGVVIENPGEEDNGIFVGDNGDGFQLYNVTVKGFEENGVLLVRVNDFVLSHITAIQCGEYGLFPVHCNGGLIEHCSATGHTDTGIYVGQSENITMNFNEAHGNVNGFEIENSSHVVANKNQSYDNTAGFLVDLLPNLPVTTSSDIVLSENHVHHNNHINFAEPGEGFESLVPSGSGILIVGTDNTTVIKNHVHNNNFTGIAVVSTAILGAIGGIPPEAFSSIEPNPDGVKVQNNVVKSNGAAPPQLTVPLPGVDLLWDGSGTGNCWSGNQYETSYPLQLPTCP